MRSLGDIFLGAEHNGAASQSGCAIASSFNVAMYDIDLFDAPQATIDSLHASGHKVICYLSAGTYENWRPDASSFPSGGMRSRITCSGVVPM